MFENNNQARVPLNIGAGNSNVVRNNYYQNNNYNPNAFREREHLKEKYYAKLTIQYGVVIAIIFMIRALGMFIEMQEYSSCLGFSDARIVPFLNYLFSMILVAITVFQLYKKSYGHMIVYICWGFVLYKIYAVYELSGVNDLFGDCYLVSFADDSNWIFSTVELVFWFVYTCRVYHVNSELPNFDYH